MSRNDILAGRIPAARQATESTPDLVLRLLAEQAMHSREEAAEARRECCALENQIVHWQTKLAQAEERYQSLLIRLESATATIADKTHRIAELEARPQSIAGTNYDDTGLRTAIAAIGQQLGNLQRAMVEKPKTAAGNKRALSFDVRRDGSGLIREIVAKEN